MNLTAIFRIQLPRRNDFKYTVLTLKREGGDLVWFRKIGFWEYYNYCFDSIADARLEFPDAVLSYRSITMKEDPDYREVRIPYKESDLNSQPAIYNHAAFWGCSGGFLLASCLIAGRYLIQFNISYGLAMIVPAFFIIVGTIIGYDEFVWW